MPAEGEMGEMSGPSAVTEVAMYKGNGTSQALTPVAELISSKSSESSSGYDKLSLSLGDFSLVIEEEGEDFDMVHAADFFDLANIDILLDIEDLLLEGIKATATFSKSDVPLIELDSTALTDGVAGPQISADFDVGTIASPSLLAGAKFATDTNDAVAFSFDFGDKNTLISDAEFETYFNTIDDMEDVFEDITHLLTPLPVN